MYWDRTTKANVFIEHMRSREVPWVSQRVNSTEGEIQPPFLAPKSKNFLVQWAASSFSKSLGNWQNLNTNAFVSLYMASLLSKVFGHVP